MGRDVKLPPGICFAFPLSPAPSEAGRASPGGGREQPPHSTGEHTEAEPPGCRRRGCDGPCQLSIEFTAAPGRGHDAHPFVSRPCSRPSRAWGSERGCPSPEVASRDRDQGREMRKAGFGLSELHPWAGWPLPVTPGHLQTVAAASVGDPTGWAHGDFQLRPCLTWRQ